MAKILEFIRPARPAVAPGTVPVPAKPRPQPFVVRVLSKALLALHFILVILWPFLRPILIIDIVFQGFRMLIGFSDKGLYVDWTFIAHYAAVMFLVCFIHGYRS